MAITLNLRKNQDIFSDPSSGNEIRQKVNIKINNDGTVESPYIFLGNRGDDGVTWLEFNISELLPDGIEDSFANRYNSVLVFKNGAYVIKKSFNGKRFPVTNDITSKTGEFEIVYLLTEIIESDDTSTENVETEREIFTSSIFKGNVVDNFAYSLSSIDAEELPEVKDEALKKPTINLYFDNASKNYSIADDKVGYKLDYLIRDFNVSPIPGFNEDATYILCVKKEDQQGRFICTNNKIWVPPLLTNNPGVWDILIYVCSDNGHEFYSNTLKVQVLDNKLDSSDLTADQETAVLEDINGVDLVDENETPIVVTPEVSINENASFKLNYTGTEVDQILTTVESNLISSTGWKNQINTEISSLQTNQTNSNNEIEGIKNNINNNYYTSAQVEEKISDLVQNSELESNYYTKAAVNQIVSNINNDIDSVELALQDKVDNSALGSYYTKTEIDLTITNLQENKVDNSDLENYYTKNEINGLTEDLQNKIDDKVDNSTLENYYTKTDVNNNFIKSLFIRDTILCETEQDFIGLENKDNFTLYFIKEEEE